MKIRTLFFLTAIVVLFSACSGRSYEDGYAKGYAEGYQAALSTEPKETTEMTTQNEPETGRIFESIEPFGDTAPLEIETSGTGGYYFILDPISLVSAKSDDPFSRDFLRSLAERLAKDSYIKFYIRAGNSFTISVPAGEYEIYYAVGDTWHGAMDLFGDDTQYYKCDEIFEFSRSSDGYSGWSIQLEPVPNGNLDTDAIAANEFPNKISSGSGG